MTTVAVPAQPAVGRGRRRPAGIAIGVVVLAALTILSMTVGSRTIRPGVVWDALWSFDPRDDEHLVVRQLRVPRTLLGLAVGAALGLAGTVMQALTRNPLAEPGILGVNAGAGAAVAIAIGLGVTKAYGYVWFAFAGAAVGGVVVYALGRSRRSGTNAIKLTLAGAAVTAVFASFTQLLLVNYPNTYTQFRFWAAGALQGRGYQVLVPLVLCLVLAGGAAVALGPALNAVALGADAGRALGVSSVRLWALAAVIVIVLSGAATAAAGPIVFIGLTAPHVARSITGPDNRWVMPMAMILASALVLGADIVGRVVARPGEVGVGIVAAIIGGPVFIVLVRRRRMAAL